MNTTSLAATIALALTTLVAAAGCGKSQAAPGNDKGSASAAATAGGAAGEKPVLGSCNDTSSHVCKEYYGVLPMLAEDLCKGLEGKGVLTKGPTPCSKDNLSGTCEIKGDEASELIYYYKQTGVSDDMNKSVCEILGKWTPAKSAAPAATNAAGTNAPANNGPAANKPAAPTKAPAPPARPAAPATKKKK